MVIRSSLDQFFIRLRQASAIDVTMATGEVQTDLRIDELTVFRELRDLRGVYGDHMSADIAGEILLVGPAALDDTRHMAFNAGHFHNEVSIDFLILGLFEVTILALYASGLFVGFEQLDNAGVRVVAGDTIKDQMFAFIEISVLVPMLDESIGYLQHFGCLTDMTLGALLGVALDLHCDSLRIADMQTTGPVTGFTLYVGLSPITGDPG